MLVAQYKMHIGGMQHLIGLNCSMPLTALPLSPLLHCRGSCHRQQGRMSVLLVIQLHSHSCQPDPTPPTPEEPGGICPQKPGTQRDPCLASVACLKTS